MNKTVRIAAACLAAVTVTGTAAAATNVAANSSPSKTLPSTTTTTVTATVNAGVTLNVRSGPGTTYATVGSVTGGTKLTGTVTNGWFKIASGTYAGRYVSAAYITVSTTTPPTNPTPPKGAITGWIQSYRTANVRSGPSFSSPVVGHVKGLSKVTGTVTGDWLKLSNGTYLNRALVETASSNPYTINARLPLSGLCKIPIAWNSPQSFAPGYTPKTQRYMNCTALSGMTALQNAFHAAKGHYAYIDLAYRTYAEQQYWYNLLGPAYANKPGTSNHGWGLAVDFREQTGFNEFNWGGTGYLWLHANAAKYGYSVDPVPYGTPHESYHWDFIG